MPRYNGGFIGHDGLDAPDAPTIGTPSAGSTEADIAFTAGAAGTTATTEFVATTNDGIGATGTSSPITITGLTNGTSYTARVYAKNSHGTSAASAASASFTPISNVVDSVFSTHLYTGNGGTQTITNNINLSGKGGLVWAKRRDSTSNSDHTLYDTARGTGTNGRLRSNNNQQAYSPTDAVTAFNNNGFSIGADASINTNTAEYVSWTFRKQPKFFDIVTYTGTGSAQNISHNLGSVPGMIIVKLINGTDSWHVYHRGVNGGTSPEDYYLQLNNEDVQIDNAAIWNDTAPTSSVFTVGTNGGVNGSGDSYVAYLFAHNNNDGGFGETDDQDIIKCGTYSNNGSGVDVNLGFEPQFMVFKRTDSSANWSVVDIMRSTPTLVTSAGDNSNQLRWNTDDAENSEYNPFPTPTGFKVVGSAGGGGGGSGTFVYMAIRRGGMRTPTAASDVFDLDLSDSSSVPAFASNFPVDMAMLRDINGADTLQIGSRIQGTKRMSISSSAEETNSYYEWDYQDGYFSSALNTNYFAWMWKRAKGYFDVVTYTGTGSGNRVLNHNLGATPEMIWTKARTSTTDNDWVVYHKDFANKRFSLNNTSGSTATNYTSLSSTSVTLADNTTNNTVNYISYFFATVSGVSKVGSFTQSGATNVACGFSGDTPALIILKCTTVANQNWHIFDSTQGIVAGNDTHLYMNTTDSKITNADLIDPYSGGFATTSSLTNGDYLFYAIAAIS